MTAAATRKMLHATRAAWKPAVRAAGWDAPAVSLDSRGACCGVVPLCGAADQGRRADLNESS
jgi:hypothetical protein